MELFRWLSEPGVAEIVARYGLVFLVVILGYVVFKLAVKYDEIQEKRIEESKSFQKEYIDLSADVNKTLDILLQTFGKRNGNGGHTGHHHGGDNNG